MTKYKRYASKIIDAREATYGEFLEKTGRNRLAYDPVPSQKGYIVAEGDVLSFRLKDSFESEYTELPSATTEAPKKVVRRKSKPKKEAEAEVVKESTDEAETTGE